MDAVQNVLSMGKRRRAAALTTAILALSVLPGARAVPAPGNRCADVNVPIRNFKIEAKWAESTVSIGDTAVIEVFVTRTSEEDPLTDEGQPYPTGRPMDEPAEDVVVGISMVVGNVFLNGSNAVTDAEGRADVKVKIKSYTRPGTGESRLYGELRHTPYGFPAPSCQVNVFEWGRLDPAPKLKVVR